MSKLPPLFSPREVLLDMNTKGSWRSLGCYHRDQCDIDKVLEAAETLVKSHKDANGNGKLRITTSDGAKVPLMYWDERNGWTETRHGRA